MCRDALIRTPCAAAQAAQKSWSSMATPLEKCAAAQAAQKQYNYLLKKSIVVRCRPGSSETIRSGPDDVMLRALPPRQLRNT